jgi:5'-nucleotidase
LNVTFDTDGVLTSVDAGSGPVRVAGGANPDAVTPNADVQSMVVDPVEQAVADLAANVIGTSEVVLDGVRGNVRTQETNEGNLIADALLWQGQELAASFGVPSPNVSLQNGGGIRNDSEIAAGDITELTTFDMLPFSNFVTVIPNIPPAQFKEIMENAVSRVESVSGRFAQISGFTLFYDPNGTAQLLDSEGNPTTPGERVVAITLGDGTKIVDNGVVVIGAPDLHIATIDFLARGGDQYPYRGAAFASVGVTYQQALANYIAQLPNSQITAADYPEGGEGRIDVVTGIYANDQIPDHYSLEQNYPNPFNPSTKIIFKLPVKSHVTLKIYNSLGQLVETLIDSQMDAGSYDSVLKSNNLTSGVYFYQLKADNFLQTRKMVLIE